MANNVTEVGQHQEGDRVPEQDAAQIPVPPEPAPKAPSPFPFGMPMAHAPVPPPGITATQPMGSATAEQMEIERLRKELEAVKDEMKKMMKMRDEAAPLLGYMRDKAKEEQSEIIQQAKRSKQQ